MAVSYKTTTDLIEAIKRKIALPISQNTFSEADLIAFLNEEMMISQVPSVLMFHEEYYVMRVFVPLIENQAMYEMPSRAIGMKLRDIFWADENLNLFEMTRVSAEDAAFFQRNVGANQAVHKFYLQNNNVVLTPIPVGSPTGSLVFIFFIRPNQLVTNDRAAFITSFYNKFVVSNTTLVDGDRISFQQYPKSSDVTVNPINTVDYYARTVPTLSNEFAIGVTSLATTNNLVTLLNASGYFTAMNTGTTTITVTGDDPTLNFITSNTTSFDISPNKGINFTSIPTNILAGSLVDFLQTTGGHKIRAYDKTALVVSGTAMEFLEADIPYDLVVGDYVCEENECIIPFLPDDLHSGLAERTCTRILSAQGDTEGLQANAAKLAEIDKFQGTLLDNRVEGAPRKITNRHSILRFNKMGVTRRR